MPSASRITSPATGGSWKGGAIPDRMLRASVRRTTTADWRSALPGSLQHSTLSREPRPTDANGPDVGDTGGTGVCAEKEQQSCRAARTEPRLLCCDRQERFVAQTGASSRLETVPPQY